MNEFEDGMILALTRPVFKAHGAHGICSPGACGTLTPEIFQFSRMLLTSTLCEVSPSDGMLVGNSSSVDAKIDVKSTFKLHSSRQMLIF